MVQIQDDKRLLSEVQLRRLKEHRYSASSCSLLDPILQYWWNWLVKQVPIWLAPNLITSLGLFINILTSLILIWYSPDAKQPIPGWACYLCALGLFAYQSLDAIDGKQARRTNTSSPLGELFDHGCDSISSVFVSVAVCVSCQLGTAPNLLYLHCFSAITLFYCAHWQTYVSGTLRFGLIDVTEAQMIIIVVHLISGYYGGAFWTDHRIFSLPLGSLPTLFGLPIGMWSLIKTLKVIFTGGCGKNGSTVAGTSVLSPIIPFSFVLIPAIMVAVGSEEEFMENYPTLYILNFGLVAAKVTNRLVVAHMTKSEMDYLDSALLGPFLIAANQYFNNRLSEKYLVIFSLLWTTCDLWKYCSKVCQEICESLNIFLFQIPNISEEVNTHKNPAVANRM